VSSKAIALGLACALSGSANAAEWNFRALLDDKPIGTHSFKLDTRGDDRTLRSTASFAVKLLGLTVYHYRHTATEQWRGDCLNEIDAATDDDGKPSKVHLAADALKPCTMSFAYWNPLIQSQTRLLNAQTGRLEAVQVNRVGTGTLDVRGTPTPATRWRISGPANPIDVWYSAQGDWIGLDSMVAGGRRLSYRLE
jgi:hypothetical protein